MDPNPEDLAGCTFEDQPIQTKINKDNQQRKSGEIEDDHKSTLRDCRRIIVNHFPARLQYPVETSRVSQRVRHLTADEIRREKGIMSKPYNSQEKNVLWIIRDQTEKGAWTDSKVVARELNIPIARAQSVTSTTYQRYENLLLRELRAGIYEIRWKDMTVTLDEALEQRKLMRKNASQKRRERAMAFLSIPTPETAPALDKRPAPAPAPELGAQFADLLGRALGVNVSGKVEIIIRLARD